MNGKQKQRLIALANKIQNSSKKVFEEFKKVFPEPLEEDLKEDYMDLVIDKIFPVLKDDTEREKYRDSLKIVRIVSYPMDTVGYVRYYITGEYSKEHILRGDFSLQTREDTNEDYASMSVFAGFLHNPIGQIRNNYKLNNPMSVLNNPDKLMENLVQEMADAMEASHRADQAYIDYVKRTGDLS